MNMARLGQLRIGGGRQRGIAVASLFAAGVLASTQAAADQVINDDLIVQQSLCVGNDCVNNENFGFDTIRLKENNTRIKFDDTSNSASFPNYDWQLTANDSSNGGANKFSIESTSVGKVPFTILGDAPTNSLFIDAQGDVGLGNSNPIVELHITDGDTPTVRLEQNSSSGFTAQTWDIAGNETNFFVRDVTHGSKLPFKIIPNAPDNSLYVNAAGNIGIGTASPSKRLHVSGNSSSGGGGNNTMALIENTSTTTASRNMIELRNFGSSLLLYNDTDTGAQWNLNPVGATKFVISREGTGVQEFAVFNDGKVEISEGSGANLNARFQVNGDLALRGVVTMLSDRNAKRDITEIDGLSVLARVREMPVSTWRYKDRDESPLHLGPVAQDFYEAFGLGGDELRLAPADVAGVALAAIKGLDSENQALKRELAMRDQKIRTLDERLAEIERRLPE